MFLFCISQLAVIFNYTYLGSGYVVWDWFHTVYESWQSYQVIATWIVLKNPMCANRSRKYWLVSYTTSDMKVWEYSHNPTFWKRVKNLYPYTF